MANSNSLYFNWFDENCVSERKFPELCNFEIDFKNATEAYPYLRRASMDFKIVFGVAIFIFTLTGLFLKGSIFGFLCSPSETATTINGLIFVQHCHQVTLAVYYLWFGVAYILPFSLEDIFGGTFCTWFSAVEMFSFFGDIYWRSALAITRLFYVKNNRYIR